MWLVTTVLDSPVCKHFRPCRKFCWRALLETIRKLQNSSFICFRWLCIGLFLHYMLSYKFGVVHNSWIKYFYGFLLKVLQQNDSLMLFMNCLFTNSFLHCQDHMESVIEHTACLSFSCMVITKCLKDTRYCSIYFIWIICQRLSSCVFRATIYSVN